MMLRENRNYQMALALSAYITASVFFMVVMFCLADLHQKIDRLHNKLDKYNQAVVENNKTVQDVATKASKYLD
jgi:wobble nucleotide-excising tRNase